ncbi:TPA: hypothetical protein ACGVAV_001436 [Vibrio vulnificus]|uniref:hypothetical protein n=1 Tax=Vibrio vulnificus TaxID=672 RepID=UPI001CCC6DDC|nr:hypothetical protein [Vibrio vulnificus]MCA0759758.1 hypothetical protein [Vibrio vulnificus]
MNTNMRIHSLLEDRSFPSMVLLDGHWGVGKTYYVKHDLQPYLVDKYPAPYKVIYISLYGVTSLDDFKDRVISLTYTENKKSSWFVKQSSDLIGSSAQVFSGTRGVSAALGGVTSIIKYHYFNKLDNLVLLLDDLERITCEKVRSQVIGECLNFTENKQHIKIVVIGNQDKVVAHTDIEKAFSDIIHIKRTPAESLDVVKKIYTGVKKLTDHEQFEIAKCLKSLELDNLRIIRRAIDRYKAVCVLFERVDGVNYNYLESKLIEASFRISTAIHREGFSLHEILEGIEDRKRGIKPSNKKIEEDTFTDIERRHLELETYIAPIRYHTPQSLATYIATYQNNFSNIHQELNIPTSTEAIELFLSNNFRDKDEEWFQENIGVLKKEVFEPNPDELLFWIRCCGLYFYMLATGYVEEKASTFRNRVVALLEANDFSLDLNYRDLEHDLHTYICDDELNRLFRVYIEKLKVKHEKAKSQTFVSDFISGYMSVRVEIDAKFAHTAFLQDFTSKDFQNALNNWSSKEIQAFIYDMHSRYDFNNIDDYFSSELCGLKRLSEQIQSLIPTVAYGVKRGALSNLDLVITNVIKRLNDRIESKQVTD